MKSTLTFLFLVATHLIIFSQEHISIQNALSINDLGEAPASPVILEISLINRGILIRRTDTSLITAPQSALLIFQGSDQSFYYFTGSSWTALLSSLSEFSISSSIQDEDGKTSVQTEEGADENIIKMDLNGQEVIRLQKNAWLFTQLKTPNSHNSILIGENAGAPLTSGNNNIIIGFDSGRDLTSSPDNVILGSSAVALSRAERQSLIIGNGAGPQATTLVENTFIGFKAGRHVEIPLYSPMYL